MAQNFLDSFMDWINGGKSPKIETVIGLEDPTIIKTTIGLSVVSLLFLGGLKIVLDSSLKKHARHMGANI